jgi:MarR family transcriptional regulator, organic hydroperoxide resistance regulator
MVSAGSVSAARSRRASLARGPACAMPCLCSAATSAFIRGLAPPRRIPRRTLPRPRSLGDVLGFMQLLWAVAHGLESTSRRMRATVGVTGPQRLVLRLVGRYGEAAPGHLAEILHVDPSSLTGVLRRLEKAGLILRVRDPADGRRAILTLTSRGQWLSDQRSGTVEAAVQKTLVSVPPRKLEVVREVLSALARDLGVETALAPRPGSIASARAAEPRLIRRRRARRP